MLGHRLVGHMERPAQAGEVGKTFVDAVLLYRLGVAAHDRVHAFE
jgi:hypothetical protein